jgi:hypothetical protein
MHLIPRIFLQSDPQMEVGTKILEEDAHFSADDLGVVLGYVDVVDENLTLRRLFDQRQESD